MDLITYVKKAPKAIALTLIDIVVKVSKIILLMLPAILIGILEEEESATQKFYREQREAEEERTRRSALKPDYFNDQR